MTAHGHQPVRPCLPEGAAAPEPAPPPQPPRPGHGRVWINSSHDAGWSASWQDGHRIADSPDGTRERAIAWARDMPATDRVVFDASAGTYVDLGQWVARA